MPRNRTIVEHIEALGENLSESTLFAAGPVKPTSKYVTISFANDEKAILDLSEPAGPTWLTVLRSLSDEGVPPYVEVDARGKITLLLQPKLLPVASIQPFEEGPDLRIEFHYSHAIHLLRRKTPGYEQFVALLRESQKKKFPVWVTETLEKHEIIDVRPDNFKKPTRAKETGE